MVLVDFAIFPIVSSCMNRDPTEISRTKLSAETIAEIINSFVEPISYKTMIFFCMFTFGLLFVSNAAFGIARSRSRWMEPPHTVRLTKHY